MDTDGRRPMLPSTAASRTSMSKPRRHSSVWSAPPSPSGVHLQQSGRAQWQKEQSAADYGEPSVTDTSCGKLRSFTFGDHADGRMHVRLCASVKNSEEQRQR